LVGVVSGELVAKRTGVLHAVRLSREDTDERRLSRLSQRQKTAGRGHAQDRDANRAIQTDNRDYPVRHELDGSVPVRRSHPRCPRAVRQRGAPWQYTKNDLDRPPGFFAVFKGAESDLPADPTLRSSGP